MNSQFQLNKKILYRKSIRQAYQNIFGRKPDLEFENKMLREIEQLANEVNNEGDTTKDMGKTNDSREMSGRPKLHLKLGVCEKGSKLERE